MEKEVKKISEDFDDSVLIKAKKYSDEYKIIIKKNDDLGFVGCSAELPLVFADGKTRQECLENIENALTISIATMMEFGQEIPQAEK